MYQSRPDHNAVFSGGGAARSWTTAAGGKINGGLALVGDTIYAETFRHELLALDANSGAVRWRAPLTNVAMTTPIVADGLVVIGTGTAHVKPVRGKLIWGRAKGEDDVEAFDASSGRPVWRYRTIGEDMPTPALVSIAGNPAIVFANGDDHVYALDLRSGKLLWKKPVQGVSTMASAAAKDGIVYVVAGLAASSHIPPHVYAVRAADGKVVWQAPYGNADCSPTVGDGLVFVEDGNPIGGPPRRNAINDLYALSAKSGSLVWKYTSPPGSFERLGSSEQAIAGLYHDGVLYQSLEAARRFAAFQARTGRVLWSIPTKGQVKMSAVLHGGRLYFGDTSGTFYTVDAGNGHIVSERRFPNIFTASPPILAGRTVYVADKDDIVAFGVPRMTSRT
jgi:outer membrane protein assembly factor BamB